MVKVYRKQEKSKFAPVVIELNSLAEVNAMKAIVGNVTGSGPARECYSSIYYALCSHSDNETGSVFYRPASMHSSASRVLGFDD